MGDIGKKKHSFFTILLLILAGEAIFILPFVLARIFRPTVLDVFEINNLELGTCFSIYGIVAFVSYFLGGSLADRFQPRNLMALSLLLTALGGIVFATFPSFTILCVLYAYWGFTTIFLFWAAMIKATRIWGGATSQGIAFGLLDGGRGLVAAAFGSLGVFVFSIFIAQNIEATSLLQKKEAFRYVILISSAIIALIAVMIFLFLKKDKKAEVISEKISKRNLIKMYSDAIKIRSVWLLMVIVLCAYVGYKVTDIFSLYAKEVMGYNEIEAAGIGTLLLYIRPIIGVAIGFLADRTKASLIMILGFFSTIIGSIVFASGILGPNTMLFFFITVVSISTAVYAFRTLYFAAMKEGFIPLALTGTAVGIISLVGYTPDIFAGPVIGYFLDYNKGESGYQYVFGMLATFSVIGFVAAIVFYRVSRKQISDN